MLRRPMGFPTSQAGCSSAWHATERAAGLGITEHSVHGIITDAAETIRLITPMFMSSTGSPGSWPSWATDVR
jgi:hypothetical protein